MPLAHLYMNMKFTLMVGHAETQDTLKILGVFLDSKLNFKAHIEKQLREACAKASALRRLRKFYSKDIMVRLYNVHVLPHQE